MDNEKTEGTETLEKNTGDQPLDLDQLIKVAVDGTESDSASSSVGDAEGKAHLDKNACSA
jgi:archaellum component FlaG (FlaF/FlaG flagellin family)